MANIDTTRRQTADPVVERTGFRLSWGAIIAGMFVATALHMVLALLGTAIGFAAWDPGDRVDTLGAGLGIWVVVSGIVALFVGGLTTGRLAGILTRGDGALHGVVLWSLSSLLVAWLVLSGLGTLVGGAFGILGRAASAAAGGVASGVGQLAGQATDLDFGMLQREIERTLEQTQSPALQPDTLRAEAERIGERTITGRASNQQVSQDIVATIRERGGEIDREAIINVITARTDMSRAEADRVATRIENLAGSAQAQLGTVADTVGARAAEYAGQASDALSRAAWWALLTLGLSLAAAVGGAVVKARE